MKNSPTKFEEPGIASVASAEIRNSAASTGARNAMPPISRMSSELCARSASSATMKNSGATTRPWLTIWSTAPCPPRLTLSSAKIPSAMKPRRAIEEDAGGGPRGVAWENPGVGVRERLGRAVEDGRQRDQEHDLLEGRARRGEQ